MSKLILATLISLSLNAHADTDGTPSVQNQLVAACGQKMTPVNQATIEHLLTDLHADINTRDFEPDSDQNMTFSLQNTCLNAAVKQGDPVAVEFVLNHKAEILKSDSLVSGFGPKQTQTVFDSLGDWVNSAADKNAAKSTGAQIINFLVPPLIAELKNANLALDTPVGAGRSSAFSIAMSYEATTAIGLLLDAGVNVNAVDAEGATALIRAIDVDSPTMVSFLLDHHASVACGKLCPLPIAVWFDDIDVIHPLLAHGADPNSADNNNEPSLQLAARSMHPTLKLIQLLVSAGADPAVIFNDKDVQGQPAGNVTALIATIVGEADPAVRTSIVEYLLTNKKVNPNVGCKNKMTPLALAQNYKLSGVVTLLTNFGADPSKLACAPN